MVIKSKAEAAYQAIVLGVLTGLTAYGFYLDGLDKGRSQLPKTSLDKDGTPSPPPDSGEAAAASPDPDRESRG